MAATQERSSSGVRNVLLLGHSGTGKTALAEALLAAAGVGGARGQTMDFEPEEQGHSLSLAVASLPWRDAWINVLDAPGGVEAFADAYPAMAAAEVAVFVVDASVGVQAQHDQLWAACDAIGLPRVVFLSHLDRSNASYQRSIDALQARCGKLLAPVHMPMGVGPEFTGVIDLLHRNATTEVDGRRATIDLPQERREQALRNRETLVEAIVETDDALLERYLDGDEPGIEELAEAFAHGIATCGFFPVLCGSGAANLGVRLLADFIVDECPAPVSQGDSAAVYVAKTLSDPYVGRINVLRVLAGDLHADDTLVVRRTGERVRLRHLFRLSGKEQTAITHCAAGDLCAVGKLEDVMTGDVLVAQETEIAVKIAPLPEPFHRVALEPASAGDEDKLSTALARLREEDPSLRTVQDPETHQLVLTAYGARHVDVTLARLQRKFGVSVNQVPLRIAYRETLRGPATGIGRHVKQSGGHGQYGVAHIEVEPLARGEGFVFSDEIVGGVIPRQLIPSVEKGIRQAMTQGVGSPYQVVDVKVRLVDGKHHSVDSSDMAFQVAGSLAFRAAAEQAGLLLLEPVMVVEVTVPDALTGDVMGDLSARRGRIQGSEQTAPGRATVYAMVPEAELLTYSAELRSLSSGSGTVTMRYDHHDEVPDNVARRVLQSNAQPV